MDSVEMPWLRSAITSTTPKNTPTTIPRTAPNTAIITDSHRIIERT